MEKKNKQQTRYRWWWWNCAWFFMFITLEPEQIIAVFCSRVYCVSVCILWRTQNEKYKHTLLLIRTNKSINTERLRIGCVCIFCCFSVFSHSHASGFLVYSPVLIAHCAQTPHMFFAGHRVPQTMGSAISNSFLCGWGSIWHNIWRRKKNDLCRSKAF